MHKIPPKKILLRRVKPGLTTRRDVYKAYKKANPRHSTHFVEAKTYVNVTKEYFEKMINALISGQILRMPMGMGIGELVMYKRPTPLVYTRMRVDFKRTKELGFTVRHENEHSKGYYYTLQWVRRPQTAKDRGICFKLNRRASRQIAKNIKTGVLDSIVKPRR